MFPPNQGPPIPGAPQHNPPFSPGQQNPPLPVPQNPGFPPGQQNPPFPGQQNPPFPGQQNPPFPGQQNPPFPGQQNPPFPAPQNPGFPPGQQNPQFPPPQNPGFPPPPQNPPFPAPQNPGFPPGQQNPQFPPPQNPQFPAPQNPPFPAPQNPPFPGQPGPPVFGQPPNYPNYGPVAHGRHHADWIRFLDDNNQWVPYDTNTVALIGTQYGRGHTLIEFELFDVSGPVRYIIDLEQAFQINWRTQLRRKIWFHLTGPNLRQYFDGFMTHEWGENEAVHATVIGIFARLKSICQLRLWIDEQRLHGNIANQLIDGIRASASFVVFLTRRYHDKVNHEGSDNWCRFEYLQALQRFPVSKFVPVVLEPEMLDTRQWRGLIHATLSQVKFVDMSTPEKIEQNAQTLAFHILLVK